MTQKKSEFLLLLLMLDDFIHLSTFREEPNISNFTPSFVFWMKGAETLMIPYFMFYGYPKKSALLR